MLVVGFEIDTSSERIINYLSSAYGVNVNAATFQIFRSPNGPEFLARIFLIEPEQVDYQTRIKGASKRSPNLTREQLDDIAKRNGVGDQVATVTILSWRYHSDVAGGALTRGFGGRPDPTQSPSTSDPRKALTTRTFPSTATRRRQWHWESLADHWSLKRQPSSAYGQPTISRLFTGPPVSPCEPHSLGVHQVFGVRGSCEVQLEGLPDL